MKKIVVVPEAIQGKTIIISVSGGKDSTATMLAVREAGLEARYVFSDTGWEAKETYAHLDVLRKEIGPIDVVGVEGGMLARIRGRSGFPARMQRWCTRELKIDPLREYHDKIVDETGTDTINVVGIRAEESQRRADMPVFGFDDTWNGYIWRPLMDWSVEEVLAVHHRHNIPINPLYEAGFSRVGCWPCIFSNKEEIRLLAAYAPERIEEIAALEQEMELQRAERNKERPGRYTHPDATFFQTKDGVSPMHIHEIVKWSQHAKGLPILAPPTGGCYRWGVCEPAQADEYFKEKEHEAEQFAAQAELSQEADDKGR